jgi:hypothetical protein
VLKIGSESIRESEGRLSNELLHVHTGWNVDKHTKHTDKEFEPYISYIGSSISNNTQCNSFGFGPKFFRVLRTSFGNKVSDFEVVTKYLPLSVLDN